MVTSKMIEDTLEIDLGTTKTTKEIQKLKEEVDDEKLNELLFLAGERFELNGEKTHYPSVKYEMIYYSVKGVYDYMGYESAKEYVLNAKLN